MARLLASETSLERKREQVRVRGHFDQVLQKGLRRRPGAGSYAHNALETLTVKPSKSRLDV